eukprot:762623_1
MARTIDASILPLGDCSTKSSDQLSKHLPKPFQIIPNECQNIPETVLDQIKNLIQKQELLQTLTPQEEDAIDDGFILCDLKTIQRKLVAWRRLFPRIKPFFALKCNPDIMVAHTLGLDPSCGFDCASIAEIKLALSSTGNERTRCIYANPQRARDDLDQALNLNIGALTFDGVEELRKVKDAYNRRIETWSQSSEVENDQRPPPPQMVIRLLVPDGHSSVPLGEKFGVAPDRVERLTQEALNLGLEVIGVSFHCGSGCHDPQAYGEAIMIASQAIDDVNGAIRKWNESAQVSSRMPECTLLDIGGGYPGLCGAGGDSSRFSSVKSSFDKAESVGSSHENNEIDMGGIQSDNTAHAIAKVVTPLVDELFCPDGSPIQIISEPGRYFVESAFIYCARIYSAKVDDDDGKRHYFIAQGVQGLFKDVLLCDETFTPIPLKVTESNATAENISNSALLQSAVHGPSGENFDIVSSKDCMLPALNVGDWLIFDRMGAYTLSIAARNSSLPVRYVLGGEGDKESVTLK